jgi:hypothetical protein
MEKGHSQCDFPQKRREERVWGGSKKLWQEDEGVEKGRMELVGASAEITEVGIFITSSHTLLWPALRCLQYSPRHTVEN